MKFRTILTLLLAAALLFSFAACSKKAATDETAAPTTPTEASALPEGDVTELTLTDDGVVCSNPAVYTANDIIYYEDGHGDSYGEGGADDAHTAEEAAGNPVVHITAPGTYRVTGEWMGQLLVDLGEGAETDENARVTLLLDGVNLNCSVAPAVLFYRVYECGDKEHFTLTPDLTNAGAAVVLQNENNITGSHVAKIYKEGTTDKLYKFDGAVYSRQSLRIEGDGILNITADNEGLNSELHLQIDGGEINIFSQDDGVNTNEDGVSVTTINGGNVTISGGNGAEGDGIDSNGAIVVNGGSLYASANPQTGDGGIDADLGIYLNGGTVIATGSRNDEISSDSAQVLMDLNFAKPVTRGAELYILDGCVAVFGFTAKRDFTAAVICAPSLQFDIPYRLIVDGIPQQHSGKGAPLGPVQPAQPGAPGSGTLPDPNDGRPPEAPSGSEPPAPPAGEVPPSGDENELPLIGIELPPEPFTPSDVTPPTGERPEPPSGSEPPAPSGQQPDDAQDVSDAFTVTADNHSFFNIQQAVSPREGVA